jgi:hypothetical protein
MAGFNANRLSYAEPVGRLLAAFNPRPGDLVSWERLNEVLQAEEPRMRGIVLAWRKLLLRRGLRSTGQGRARGAGIYFLSGREDAAEADHLAGNAARRQRKLSRRVNDIDDHDFSAEEKTAHELRKRFNNEMAHETTRIAKQIASLVPPTAIASNARVLKE